MPPAPTLTSLLTTVQSLADAKTFTRGKAYFYDGAVSNIEKRNDSVDATVTGTQRYEVILTVGRDGELAYTCNCPVGQGGIFCKHAVAVALACLQGSGEALPEPEAKLPEKPTKKRRTNADVIREYVTALDKDVLQEFLLDAAEFDRNLRDKLLLAARATQASDLSSMKEVVRTTTRVQRPLDWREAGIYAEKLAGLVDTLRQRLAGPHAAEVVELSELAIAGADKGLEKVDDSNGYVWPTIHELAAVHLEACEQTRPDPAKLAERLFRLQKNRLTDVLDDVFTVYANPLGEVGQRRYRQLVTKAWEALPDLAPSKGEGGYLDSERIRLERRMLEFAELDGDVDAAIRIYTKDLSDLSRFEDLARLCEEHGRMDEGLAWAERGLEVGGEAYAEVRLIDFCVDAHLHRKAFDKAEAFAWQRFVRYPSGAAFAKLVGAAASFGKPEEVRARALAHLWGLVKEQESGDRPKRDVDSLVARSELVRIFLEEEKSDEAWEAFVGGPVHEYLRQHMVILRGKTHPRDAIALYREMLPDAVQRGYSGKYDEAAGIVRAIGELRRRLGEHDVFLGELEEIRVTYRARKNFIKAIAGLG